MHEGRFLKEYIENAPMQVTTVVERTGIKRPTIYTHFNKEKLKVEIKATYTNGIGIKWPGENKESISTSNGRVIGDYNETEYEEGSRFRKIGPDMYMMRTELVTEKAKAGWLRGFADPEYQEELPVVELPVDFQATGDYIAFVVEGDSMDDGSIKSIPNKTVVIGRDLAQHKWQPRLHNNDWPNWVFVHKSDGILIKQIADQDLEEGWIVLRSINPDKNEYPDIKISIKDIYKIYNVVRRILPD